MWIDQIRRGEEGEAKVRREGGNLCTWTMLLSGYQFFSYWGMFIEKT
jgi:hypothetical protein